MSTAAYDSALTMVKVEAAVAAAAPFNTVLRETKFCSFFIVFSSKKLFVVPPALSFHRCARPIVAVEEEDRAFPLRFAQPPGGVAREPNSRINRQPASGFPGILGKPLPQLADASAPDSECRLDV